MIAANAATGVNGRRAEDTESLIGSEGRQRAKLNEPAKAEDDADASGSDSELVQTKSVRERRRELERLRIESEPGWARLD